VGNLGRVQRISHAKFATLESIALLAITFSKIAPREKVSSKELDAQQGKGEPKVSASKDK